MSKEYVGIAPMTAEECLEILKQNANCYGEYLKVKIYLKALEIIKKKRINVGDFMLFARHKENTLELWNSYFTSERQLTQEEFDLLKKELL